MTLLRRAARRNKRLIKLSNDKKLEKLENDFKIRMDSVDLVNFQGTEDMTEEEMEQLQDKIMRPNPEGEYLLHIENKNEL